MRQRVPDLVGVSRPRWTVAKDIDLDYHVQHVVLPPGTTDEGLLRIVADLHEPVLDRNRPKVELVSEEGEASDIELAEITFSKELQRSALLVSLARQDLV